MNGNAESIKAVEEGNEGAKECSDNELDGYKDMLQDVESESSDVVEAKDDADEHSNGKLNNDQESENEIVQSRDNSPFDDRVRRTWTMCSRSSHRGS